MSILALRPTQPLTEWYCGIFTWGSSSQDGHDHSPPSDDEVNNCSYASTPPSPLCHHSMYRDNNRRLLVAHQITHKSCLTQHCPSLTLSLQQFHSWMLTYIHTSFTFIWPCIVTNFFVIKPTRCINFTNLFCRDTLHVSDGSSVLHKEFIHYTLSNGICHTSL